METMIICLLFAVGLFAATLICLYVGWRLGRRRFLAQGDTGFAGLGSIDGSVYGLMGLLIAFTFTGAAGRFLARTELITQHVNAIGTNWLRLDLLESGPRDELRGLLRRYTDSAIKLSRSASDPSAIEAEQVLIAQLQTEIWAKELIATQNLKTPVPASLILTSTNQMFDIGLMRVLATRQHPPAAIYLLLGFLVPVCGLLAGFGMAKAEKPSRLHMIGFSAVLALSIYLILDLEFPRLGLVRIDRFDQAMIELRASMN